MAPKLSCPVYKNACPLQLSESSVPSSIPNSNVRPLTRPPPPIGSIPPPGIIATQNAIHGNHSTLTLANLARINNANAQDCHQGKASLHQTLKKGQPHHSESVADASYYSSVLASFGSTAAAVGGSIASGPMSSSAGGGGGGSGVGGCAESGVGGSWQQSQYYR